MITTQEKTTQPQNIDVFTDKYFLNALKVLEEMNLNPWVRMQVFARGTPGIVAGVKEATDFILANSDLLEQGGAIYAIPDGKPFTSKEPLMEIVAPIQTIVNLETMYLGIISTAMTEANIPNFSLNFDKIKEKARKLTMLAGDRPIYYFGARHWHHRDDEAIAQAVIEGGFKGASTDIGAAHAVQKGVGTIPHVLEVIFDYERSLRANSQGESAVVNATKAFDKYMPREIPRVALIDYHNQEITDALRVVKEVPSLYGIRIDTCGENVPEGGARNKRELADFLTSSLENSTYSFIDYLEKSGYLPYFMGKGVTVSGVYALRKALNMHGAADKKIMLSSGFGNTKKLEAFLMTEASLKDGLFDCSDKGDTYPSVTLTGLFDSLGVGGVIPSIRATADVHEVGDTLENMKPYSKAGREKLPSDSLELVAGGGNYVLN